eukprot:TRINITY_DN120329_c2_g1_i1.p1 TRINITY_DN120329_c2_g1~~TRINITY_DN120329_c2_g1_i1.p1  ORF type:complete len:483 (+),score=27.86 TRINITY_DN120329_c2_g1_i1:2413-3861(+)
MQNMFQKGKFFNQRKKKKKYEPQQPLETVDRPPLYPHAPRPKSDYIDSLISKKGFDPIKSYQFEGAINLGSIVLALLVLKYTYINLSTNGYLLLKETKVVYCIMQDLAWLFFCDVVEGIFTLGTFGLYMIYLNGTISKRFLLGLHYTYLLLFGCTSLWGQWCLTPLPAMISSMFLIAYIMKMHSYIATNILLHAGVKKKYEEIVGSNRKFSNPSPQLPSDPDSIYPANVNLRNYLYYIFCAPSLVYETKFLRTQKFRFFYILKELVAFGCCSFGIVSIISQFILPVTMTRGEESLTRVLGDIFSMCIPSLFIWLLIFYAYFHCWLNAKSEIVGFANREFYKDWWNADSIGAFWRKWNLPVHEWCLRHLYIESMYYFNASKDVAAIIVFLVSTVMHEFYLSVAFKVYHPFFFFAMVAQIPLLFLNRKIRNSRRVGNLLMWISLMIGQPLLEILYFRNWVLTRYKNEFSFWCSQGQLKVTNDWD